MEKWLRWSTERRRVGEFHLTIAELVFHSLAAMQAASSPTPIPTRHEAGWPIGSQAASEVGRCNDA